MENTLREISPVSMPRAFPNAFVLLECFALSVVNAWKFFNKGWFIGVSFVRFWLSLWSKLDNLGQLQHSRYFGNNCTLPPYFFDYITEFPLAINQQINRSRFNLLTWHCHTLQRNVNHQDRSPVSCNVGAFLHQQDTSHEPLHLTTPRAPKGTDLKQDTNLESLSAFKFPSASGRLPVFWCLWSISRDVSPQLSVPALKLSAGIIRDKGPKDIETPTSMTGFP